MERVTLGRTGLSASVMGLGAGGASNLGNGQGKPFDNGVAIVRQALDLGVNVIDTAEAYTTEEQIGVALRGVPRESFILSTKFSPFRHKEEGHPPVRSALEGSLRRLGLDYVDVYHVHGVSNARYDAVVEQVYPEFVRLREEGKIRFIGITETFGGDPAHAMLARAVPSGLWDVVMIGHNMLNFCARENVFPAIREHNIGVLVMHAVRHALTSAENLSAMIRHLVSTGEIDPDSVDPDDPLPELRDEFGGYADVAYRFCLGEREAHCTLSGTGNPDHLARNAQSMEGPPLDAETLRRIESLFGRVTSVSGSRLK